MARARTARARVVEFTFRHVWAAALVGLAAALVPALRPVLQNGDTAVYNDQIDAGQLGRRTVHFGYILLGSVFHRLLPGQTDWQMNLMTLLFGLAGMLAVYATSRVLTGSGPGSFVAGASLLAVPAYVRGMLASEVDVPLAACVALAFACWIRGRDKTAAALFGFAMLVSPLASLALPAFLLTPNARAEEAGAVRVELQRQLRRILVFALVSLAVYLPVVVYHHGNYFNGGRGLFHTARSPYNLVAQFRRSVKFFRAEPAVLAVEAVGAVVALLRRRRAWLLGILSVALASVLFGERFDDVPVELPTSALAAPLLAFAVSEAWSRVRAGGLGLRTAAAAGLLATVGLLAASAVQSVTAGRTWMRRLWNDQRVYSEMRTAFSDPLVLVRPLGFTEARTFERIVVGRTHTDRVFSFRQLHRRCRRLAHERHTFLFAHAPFEVACEPLERRYEAVSKTFRGIEYHFLVPKPHP